jgi:hypothetical protein
MESQMPKFLTLSQARTNAWIRVKLDYKATLATTDGIEIGFTGKWEVGDASSADRYMGLDSINPDYKNWILYQERHTLFFLNTIEVTGGGAMDTTDRKRFVYNKGDGSVENIFKLLIDAAITTFGYIDNVVWVGSSRLGGQGTGFISLPWKPLAPGQVEWNPS